MNRTFATVSSLLMLSLLVGALLLTAMLACGCNQYSTPTATTEDSGADKASSSKGDDKTPEQVLTAMAKRYRTAKTYQDAGTVTLKFQQNGQQVNRQFDFSVAFDRPGKLKIDGYGVSLRVDGKKYRAAIKDYEEVAGQVLELDAPAELTLENVLVDDTVMRALGEGVGQAPPQIVLLLDDAALDKIQNKQTPTFMPKQKYEDHSCYRVRIDSEYGPLIVWIDEKTLAVRRMDFPTQGIRKGLEQNGPVEGLELFADYSGARFDAPVPAEAFQFEVPDGAMIVKRLLGPAPSPPTPLLGKELPAFSFTGLDGAKVTRETIKDKIVVLDFWFTECSPCQQSFPLMNQVYQKYKDSDKVMFLAVNADDASLSDQTVRDTMKRWGSEIPVARDPDQNIRNAFQITGMPTLFITGSDGTVQYFEMGLNPNLTTELPAVIEKLLSGKSVADETRKRFDDRLADFKRAQQTPPEARPTDGQTVEIPKATIAPASQPANHKLTKLWTAADIKSPGNLLVIPGGNSAETKVLVFDGWETIVELATDGKKVAEHKLDLPKDAIVAIIRTALDGEGKRHYALFLSNQQQVFVYDESWKQVLAFPPAGSGQHEGLGDVQIVDLDGDGKLELAIGYYGDVGLQLVSFDGKRLWNERSALQWVTRIATSGPDAQNQRQLLCANSRGGIATFDPTGKTGPEIVVPGRPLQSVYAANHAGGSEEQLCGLSGPLGVSTLVGFNIAGKELWTFDLAKGVHQKPIEVVTYANFYHHQTGSETIQPNNQWLVAGADGSVTLLSTEGKQLDRFNTGATLTGLAGAMIGNDPVLLISSEKTLEAWKIDPK